MSAFGSQVDNHNDKSVIVDLILDFTLPHESIEIIIMPQTNQEKEDIVKAIVSGSNIKVSSQAKIIHFLFVTNRDSGEDLSVMQVVDYCISVDKAFCLREFPGNLYHDREKARRAFDEAKMQMSDKVFPSASASCAGTASSTFSFNFLSSSSSLQPASLNKEEYLKALNALGVQPAAPLVRKIIGSISTIPNAFKSEDIVRGRNDLCVPASFSTMMQDKNTILGLVKNDESYSRDNDIEELAKALSLSKISIHNLCIYLKQGKRCFIRTDAIYSRGLHAYCAFELIEYPGQAPFIAAWDPDNDEFMNVKKIPIEKIDKDMIFTCP